MLTSSKTRDESARIASLRQLNLLDTIEEQQYDNITELASYICQTPIALISLVDENRQWFKSKIGMEVCQTDRNSSFCAHAIHDEHSIMEIPDARQDDRFFDNPLVKKKENPVIFYAGIPVLDDNGLPLGTLCVIDNVPRRLSQNKRKALRNLGKQVEELIKLHRLNEELQASRRHLVKHNTLLEAFAGNVSHDMKMPLANLIITSDILSKKYNELLDGAGKKYLKYLKTSSLALSDYINSILEYYKSTSYELEDRTKFDLNDLLENIIELINIKHHCTILLPEVNRDLFCNRVALEQIFLNLIGNGIKYNDKPETIVKIEDWEDETHYWFSIEDNGQGIPAEKIDYIFDLFSIVAEADRDGKRGHGIGLSTVKQLTLSLGGDISVISKLGHMSKFTFSIAK